MKPETVQAYLDALPENRAGAFLRLREAILSNLPEGFTESMGYGMPCYRVPHALYPAGYHCDPKEPLPFISLANQKNFIAFYHMGLYAHEGLLEWYTTEYAKQCKTKLDMGKSCTRFKKMEDIPYALIGELCGKVTVQEWIRHYEENVKR